MSGYDYIVIGVYLVFLFCLGPVYKSFSKTASDYFRGGGGMLWWVVGSSAFMTTFSAWSFTGGAAKAYETGTFFLLLFACNLVALVFCLFFTAHRFRQMRVVTPVEAIRKRFGATSEQVFTWLPIVFNTLMGGIWLYTVSVFMSGVFGLSLAMIIVSLGVVMVGMTLLGGSWAATAGDFVQMLVVMMITLIMSSLTLAHREVGGLAGLVQKLPAAHFDWTEFSRPWVIVVFAVTLLLTQVTSMNSMLTGAARYVFVKDGRDARKAVLISIAGFLLLAPLWMIPAVGATVIFPDLARLYPQLNNPREAAYVAMAVELLPPGLLGLLVCGIFSASLTSMNSLLNSCAGIFVRNFYIRKINVGAPEAKQILVGRIFTTLYGALWILVALIFKDVKSLQLFNLILLASASLGLPTAIPLTYGLFFKRTPDWAGWSTMVVGFVIAIAARFTLTKDFLNAQWGRVTPLSTHEIADLGIALTAGAVFLGCSAWFFLSMLFHPRSRPEERRRVDDFFTEMNTPVIHDPAQTPVHENDRRQYLVLGNLCLAYGCLTLLLLAIPNPTSGRLLILACGGVVVVIGLILRRIARRMEARA